MTHGLPVCGPAQGNDYQSLSDASSVRHLIRADPDEELHIPSGCKGSPESSQGLTSLELAGLRARLKALEAGAEAAEKHRLRSDRAMEQSVRAMNSLIDELRGKYLMFSSVDAGLINLSTDTFKS
jgi:hypothetical protein